MVLAGAVITLLRKKICHNGSYVSLNMLDRLLTDFDTLDHWPQRVKLMQKNWIGRSEGTEFSFEVPIHPMNAYICVYYTC